MNSSPFRIQQFFIVGERLKRKNRIYSGGCENYLNDAYSHHYAGQLVNLPERDFYPYGKKGQDNAKIGKCFTAL